MAIISGVVGIAAFACLIVFLVMRLDARLATTGVVR
jgi:hypothetical protein